MARVLIIDDDRDFADDLANYLMRNGYAARTANSADAALSLGRDFEPAMACLDIRLGGAHGVDLIPQLRKSQPDLICVMMTAHEEVDMAIEALHEGAYDYLRKPLHDGEVLAVLNRCFEVLRLKAEKRAAEETARSSESRLLTALNTISEGFALYDAEDRLVLFNDGYRETFPNLQDVLKPGVKFEDFVRAGAERGLVVDAVDRVEEYVQERMERHRNPSGPNEYLQTRGRWIRTEEHRTADGGVVGIRTDITERKQIEIALQENEALLRAIIDNSPSVIVLKDLEGRFIFVNETFAKIRGGRAKDQIGQKAYANSPDDHAAAMIAQDREVMEDRKVVTRERFTTLRDGTPYNRIVTKFPVNNAMGALMGVATISTDITELHHARRALEESQARLRAIIDNAPWLITLKDLEGRYWVVNKRFEEWYGLSADEVLGRLPSEFFADEFNERFLEEDRKILETNQPSEMELDIPFADGSLHKIISNKFPVFDANGKTIGIGGINTDVSEQRGVEAQLLQAQKMEAVGQLTGGVAHDFNNLLTVVLGNLEFVQENLKNDPESRGFLDAAMGATERGAELTGRLLAFSRKQALSPTVLELNALVPKLSELMRRVLGEDIDIQATLAEELWPAMVDAGQLENALLNLAINARDAMPDGGRLTIETDNVRLDREYADTHAEVTPGPYVMLAVSDTGQGMPPDVQERVFEPFFTTKEAGRGSGLGLSMIYGFVKQSGGHVSLYSEQGHGTTVKLYLPRASAHEQKQAEERIAITALPTGNETVLIVENDDDVRAIAVRILKELGYLVLEAGDGPAALAELEAARDIDLLFTDVVMPGGMNGRQTADAVLKLRPDAKVLFTSGYTENAIVHHGRLDPGVDLLTKPYSKAGLAVKIRNILDSRE